MSFQIRNIREVPGDRISKFANELSKKLSRFLTKDQLELLDDKEDIYTDGRDIESFIKVHGNLTSTKTFDFSTEYYPPLEPDNDKLKLWVRGRAMGNFITDWSTFDNEIFLDGEPLLIDGTPHDDGIHTDGVKSVALRFNRPTSEFVDAEFVGIEDNSNIITTGLVTGISYFMRVRIHAFDQSVGIDRRLFEKTDDGTPNNGVVCKITSDGRIQFQIVRGGVTTVKQTPASTLTTNVVYDIWFTYTVAGNVIHIYVNNVDQTLTTPSAISWHGSTTNFDMRIMKRGPGAASGYVYGDLYDFRIYKELVVSAAQVGYHYTNKWSISNLLFGQVMISNYWATVSVAVPSYTSASFTTSFDI